MSHSSSKEDLEHARIPLQDESGETVMVELGAVLKFARQESGGFRWFEHLVLPLAIPACFVAYLVSPGPSVLSDFPIGWAGATASLIGGGFAGYMLFKSRGLATEAGRLHDEIDELKTRLEKKSVD